MNQKTDLELPDHIKKRFKLRVYKKNPNWMKGFTLDKPKTPSELYEMERKIHLADLARKKK